MSEEKSARELVDEIRANLEAAGNRRAYGAQIEQGAMHDVAHWVRQGEGVLSVAEMARLSGVSRDTIYTILKQDPTS